MTSIGLKGGRVLLSVALTAGLGLLSSWAVPARAGSATGRVEFDCKVVPRDNTLHTWVVELRGPSGEPVRMMAGLSGSILHFKDLSPRIYTVCVIGLEHRQSCESVDLTPPPGKNSFHFRKAFEEPERVLHAEDLNSVSRLKLEVPAEAREEMLRSQMEQLRGNTDQAIAHLKRALKIDPEYSDALNNLGAYYHRQSKYDKAIECYEKVTKLDPDFYGGWVNLAGSLIATAEFQRALEANKRAYALRPNDTLVISQMALNYFYLHDLAQAKQFFLTLLSRDPASPVEPQLYLVHIALAEKNKDEAAHYIKEFLSVHPNAPQAADLKDTLANLSSITFTPDQ